MSPAGVVLVPEGRGIFAPMTVAENLELGAYLLNDKAEFERRQARVFDLFPRLRERLGQISGSLSGGEQQMLAVGRALMADPKILLLTSRRLDWRRASSRKSWHAFTSQQERSADHPGRAKGTPGASSHQSRLSALGWPADCRNRSAHHQIAR